MEAPKQNGNGNTIEIPTPFGGKVRLSGPIVIIVVCLAAMIAGLGYWAYWEVQKRDKIIGEVYERIELTEKIILARLGEVEKGRQVQLSRLNCLTELNLFVYVYPRGQVDWSMLPTALYECAPNFKMK